MPGSGRANILSLENSRPDLTFHAKMSSQDLKLGVHSLRLKPSGPLAATQGAAPYLPGVRLKVVGPETVDWAPPICAGALTGMALDRLICAGTPSPAQGGLSRGCCAGPGLPNGHLLLSGPAQAPRPGDNETAGRRAAASNQQQSWDLPSCPSRTPAFPARAASALVFPPPLRPF